MIHSVPQQIPCFLCYVEPEGGQIIICPKKNQIPEHRAHLNCQRAWAIQKRKDGWVDDRIICTFNSACKTPIAFLLPSLSKQRIVEILRAGISLIALNKLAISLLGEGPGKSLGMLAAGVVMALKNEGMKAGADAMMTGLVFGTDNGIAKIATTAFATMLAIRAGRHIKNYGSIGLAFSTIFSGSILVNGGSWTHATIYPAITALSTYWTSTKNIPWLRNL